MKFISALVAATCLSVPVFAFAQEYPARLIRFIVAFPPGSSTDTVARIVGHKLTDSWGHNVVIENRPGAGGNVAAQTAKRANADGYSLLVNASAMAVNVSLYANRAMRCPISFP